MLGDRLLAFGPAIRVRLPHPSRPLRLQLIVIPLVALFGWYSFGLFQQADTPAAADPFTGLEQFLEANGLSYGLGGYWEASVITVDTGGAITIRAVSPSCIQPYAWENKLEWYDPTKNVANFVLLSNQPGYFTSFQPRGTALLQLQNMYKGKYDRLDYGNYFFVPNNANPVFDYEARTYQGNILTQLPALYQALNKKGADSTKPVSATNAEVYC
jgi:hypothetical protein